MPNTRAGNSNTFHQQNLNYNQYNQVNQNQPIQRPNIPTKNYKGSK